MLLVGELLGISLGTLLGKPLGADFGYNLGSSLGVNKGISEGCTERVIDCNLLDALGHSNGKLLITALVLKLGSNNYLVVGNTT